MWMLRSRLGATCARTERGGDGPASRREMLIHTRLGRLWIVQSARTTFLPVPALRAFTTEGAVPFFPAEGKVPLFPEPKVFGSTDSWPAVGRPAGGGNAARVAKSEGSPFDGSTAETA